MADDETPETDAPEAESTDATDAPEVEADAAPKLRTPRVGLQGLLTRDSDAAARPGFRNPSNNRSKAQKKGKKGKKKRSR